VNQGQDEEDFPEHIAKLKAYLQHLQTHKSESSLKRSKTLDTFSSSSDSVTVSAIQPIPPTLPENTINVDAVATAPAPNPLDTLVQALSTLTANPSRMTKAQFTALDQNAIRDYIVTHYVTTTHLTARDRHQIFTLLAVTEPGNTLSATHKSTSTSKWY
jgi:hypothetical protein